MAELAELRTLEKLISRGQHVLRVDVPSLVGPGEGFPLYTLTLGSKDPGAPAIGFFGGVHGNERIGTHVVLAYLHTLLELLDWDISTQEQLRRVRLVFMPIVNPSGMAAMTRSTSMGIDLMRNSPVDSANAHWLAGGQRLSRYLPWYRGKRNNWAPENRVLVDLVRRELLSAPFSMALDCHSGFGMTDRIWFPYAHTRAPIPHLAEIYALRNLFRGVFPNHISYRIEPQCYSYMTHGDVWDYLYMESLSQTDKVFLPFTLEMGSWLWVRKNPMQLIQPQGLFNPLVPHRLRRILRQHLVWFDFMLRAAGSFEKWRPNSPNRAGLREQARVHWRNHYRAGGEHSVSQSESQTDAG